MTIYDSVAIQQILPHRYPFLLVDRIVELEPRARIVGINDPIPATPQSPFGGMKQSGLGRELGMEGLDAYFETKYVAIGLRQS